MRYRKIRFYSKEHGPTAGLVVRFDGKTMYTLTQLSKLFPITEAPKMKRFQAGPIFDTWEEAFNFEFPPIPGMKG